MQCSGCLINLDKGAYKLRLKNNGASWAVNDATVKSQAIYIYNVHVKKKLSEGMYVIPLH